MKAASDNGDGTLVDRYIPCSSQHRQDIFSITPNGTEDPEVERLPLFLNIKFDSDSDGIVGAGMELPVTVEMENWYQGRYSRAVAGYYLGDSIPPDPLEWITVSSSQMTFDSDNSSYLLARGGELQLTQGDEVVDKYGHVVSRSFTSGTLIIPSTVPDGEYTISARIIGTGNGGATPYDGETTITVGDPGINVSSAELALGSVPHEARLGRRDFYVFDNPLTYADETTPETDTAPASDGEIWVELSVINSLGNIGNGSGLTSASVIGAGGKFTVYPSTADDAPSRTAIEDGTGENSAIAAPTNNVPLTGKMWIKVEKANKKPGPVTMYATVIGDDGSTRSNSITLYFTGPPDAITLAESSSSLRSVNVIEEHETVKDEIKFELTAVDEGGNTVDPDLSGYALRIAGPDDKPVSSTNISRSQPTKSAADGKFYITLTNESGTAAAPLAPGAYTLTAKKGDLEAEVGFAVAGPSTNLSLSSSSDTRDSGLEVVTATATVTDRDGNAVSDRTPVSITAGDATILSPVGVAATSTTDGSASSQFAVVGTGRTTIIGESNGVVDVVVFDNSGGDPNVAGGGISTSWENGDPCLTRYHGYATYRCDANSSAAEIFNVVSSRGATAIHAWNGDNWVRFSEVNGEAIPGSSDFQVITNDVLYISY